MRFLRTATAAMLAIGAVVASQAPASAATYTWMNMDINPTGTRYYDHAFGSQSKSFSRTGIGAQIVGANGPTWQTKVWFGSYSTTGQDAASISGPRSYISTSASFKFLPGTTSSDRQRVKAWLQGAVMARQALTDSVSEIQYIMDSASVPAVTSNGILGLEIALEGEAEGLQYWRGQSAELECLFIVAGDYVSTSCAEKGDFERETLTLEMSGPHFNTKATLMPESFSVAEESQDSVEMVSDSLALWLEAESPGRIKFETGAGAGAAGPGSGIPSE